MPLTTRGIVRAIYVAPSAGAAMEERDTVEALAGRGLKGDRYCTGEGSWNKATGVGNRQATLINRHFFEGTDFSFSRARRNIITDGTELMRLINQEFQIGHARFRGVKYCYPCERPSGLAGTTGSFREQFFDRAGLIAEIIETGLICTGNEIIPCLM